MATQTFDQKVKITDVSQLREIYARKREQPRQNAVILDVSKVRAFQDYRYLSPIKQAIVDMAIMAQNPADAITQTLDDFAGHRVRKPIAQQLASIAYSMRG